MENNENKDILDEGQQRDESCLTENNTSEQEIETTESISQKQSNSSKDIKTGISESSGCNFSENIDDSCPFSESTETIASEPQDESYSNQQDISHYDMETSEDVTASNSDEEKQPKKRHVAGNILKIICVAAVGFFAGYGLVSFCGSFNNKNSEEMETNDEVQEISITIDASDHLTEDEDSSVSISSEYTEEMSIEEVAETVMPSVVSVYSTYGEVYTETSVFGDLGMETESVGSGFIAAITDTEILVVTNNHVIEDADSLSVQFINGTSIDAVVKGSDASSDVAIVAVQIEDVDDDTLDSICEISIGDSESLKIGQSVVAIGNALGYGQSVTSGIISALDRELESGEISGTFIQTDAAINPGNSGGPLVDLYGNVIGITSSKIGGSTIEGMGYAIPISDVLEILDDLMSEETRFKVDEDEKGTLGITGVSITSDVSSVYGMPVGAYVYSVIEGGGAEEAGIQKGDIITALDGREVESMEELQEELSYYESGETVTITIQRLGTDGEYSEIEIDVTLSDSSLLAELSDEEVSEETDGQNNIRRNPYNR